MQKGSLEVTFFLYVPKFFEIFCLKNSIMGHLMSYDHLWGPKWTGSELEAIRKWTGSESEVECEGPTSAGSISYAQNCTQSHWKYEKLPISMTLGAIK